jgi:hypothetical protein
MVLKTMEEAMVMIVTEGGNSGGSEWSEGRDD